MEEMAISNNENCLEEGRTIMTIIKLQQNETMLEESGSWGNQYGAFSPTWAADMQVYWNKRKCLYKKRVELPQDWFGTLTWPPGSWYVSAGNYQ